MTLDYNDIELKETTTCPVCKSTDKEFWGNRGPETHSITKSFPATDALKKKLSAIKVHKCKKCDLLYCSPVPVYDQRVSSVIYNADYCSSHRSVEKEAMNIRIKKFSEELASVLNKLGHQSFEGLRYLDVAAGGGDMLVAGNMLGMKSEGIDLSTAVCDFAKEVHGVEVKPYAVEDPRLEEGVYDFLTLKDIIEHVPNPLELLKSSMRLLKPKGGMYLTTPNERGLVMRIGNMAKGKGHTVNLSPCADPYHLIGFGNQSLDYLFNELGLEIVAKKTVPVILKPTGSFKQKMKIRGMNLFDSIGSKIGDASEFLIVVRKKS